MSNWLNFLYTELYNSATHNLFLWASQIALIQPVHGQGYILIFLDRMHLLFTQVHFLFWLLGRGQYVTVVPMKALLTEEIEISLYIYIFCNLKHLDVCKQISNVTIIIFNAPSA